MIKAIILDLEGVFINIDYQMTFDCFKDLGRIVTYDSQFKQLVEYYDSGKWSTEFFFNEFKKVYHWDDLKFTEFKQAWNAMLRFVPDDRIEYLMHLKQKHPIKIFMLSNINELHAQFIEVNYGAVIKSLFDARPFYSYQSKYLKPEPDSFLTVLNYLVEEFNIQADSTLFIDDTTINITAAEKLGMVARKFAMNGVLKDGVEQLGVVITSLLSTCSIKGCQKHLLLSPKKPEKKAPEWQDKATCFIKPMSYSPN